MTFASSASRLRWLTCCVKGEKALIRRSRATPQTYHARSRAAEGEGDAYVMNLALRWQLEWLCTYLTISKQIIEMIVGPGRRPLKSTLAIPVVARKVGCVGPADLKA
jgi:hypothetical protein